MSDESAPQSEEPTMAADAPVAPPQDRPFDVGEFSGGLPGALEAVLMVLDEPVPAAMLGSALERPVAEIEQALTELEAGYTAENRGFTLRNVAGGWRIYSRSEYAPAVERFLLDGQQARLSQAALETLAVIAYRQPVSRSRVSAIRGVNVDGVVRTLHTRGLIHEVGQDETTSAVLYGTTDYFLERLGLQTLDELPPLAPHLPSAEAFDELVDEGHW